jgi:hypothetical protein
LGRTRRIEGVARDPRHPFDDPSAVAILVFHPRFGGFVRRATDRA